jgi:conjugal transfer/entry exclusion protein
MLRRISKLVSLTVAAGLVVTTTPSRAWIATEVTQVMNNIELVAQVQKQVQTVTNLVETFKVHVGQLNAQYLAGMAMSGLGLADIARLTRDIDGYQNALKAYKGDLASLSGIFDTRMTEAKLMNLPFNDYLQREMAKIANDNGAAKARVLREQQVMQQVQKDGVQIQKWGGQIQGTAGVHQAAQILNGQVNMMTQQLGSLVMMKAEQQGSEKADRANKEAAEDAASLEIQKGLIDRQQAMIDKNNAVIGSMPKR